MRTTVPVLLMIMAAPVSQSQELHIPYIVNDIHLPAPSAINAITNQSAAPTEILDALPNTTLVVSEDRSIMQELAEFRNLRVGWDGAYGRPAIAWSLNAAIDYLLQLSPTIPEPSAMISSSGEVSLYWMNGDAYAEIGFDEVGTCFMFAEDLIGRTIHLDDLLPDDPSFVGAVRRVFGVKEFEYQKS